jgi:hypothetical protein
VALELNKLTYQLGQMGQVMAARQRDHAQRTSDARAVLRDHALVTPELRAKISVARQADESWRGADPLGEHLDERHMPPGDPIPTTLMGVDGSQVYPNRHDIAPYFLINVGSIVLRQGSGQAPQIDTRPTIYFQDENLYDDAGRLCRPDFVDSERARQELDMLVTLAEQERAALGGDITRPLLALNDGPLLPWQPQRRRTRGEMADDNAQFSHFVEQMDRLCRLHVIPLGYVDRPGSANLLRTLELTRLPLDGIDRRTVRHGEYRLLTDRVLLADLASNERTGFFVSTSESNTRLQKAMGSCGSYQVGFFLMNVARPTPADQQPHPAIARVELPTWDWVIRDTAVLDLVQSALFADCALTRYPYTLARAHELAVIGSVERANLESMLQLSMWRSGVVPAMSEKAYAKRQTRSRQRR